jgi:hypothetical protein
MNHFCTYFDRHYLARGLTLYRSLARHAEPFLLWVLCYDDFTYEILSRLNLPSLRLVSLCELERDDEALLAAKHDRSGVEYYFTCTPSWLLHVLRHVPEVDLLTYMDADLFFYASPSPIYEELGDQSILIVGHRYPEPLRHFEKFGVYNVGLLAFRNDAYGRECLQWWRDRCLEWCYDRVEEGRFADQKYLDDWPDRFHRVTVLQHRGAGLAPWNVSGQRIWSDGTRLMVDELPLVFFHFHRFAPLNRWLVDPGLSAYRAPLTPTLKRLLFAPYLRELKRSGVQLQAVDPTYTESQGHMRRPYTRRMILNKVLHRRLLITVRGLVV